MKFGRITGLATAATLFATITAAGGPIKPPRPQFAPQSQQTDPIYWRRHRHHHYTRSYGYDGYDPAFAGLFWPLAGAGWDAYDSDCAFYGCSYGWGLGPFAWGLFGLGYYDPFGLYGWGWGNYGYAGGLAGQHFGGRHWGGHHWAAQGFAAHHRFGGYRHFAGIHRGGFHHFGGHGFGGRGFMAFHGGGGFRGGGGFHGGGGHHR